MIEVMLSLSVLLIIGGMIIQGERNIFTCSHRPLPEVEWYLMLHELENPVHNFQINRNNQISTITKSKKSRKGKPKPAITFTFMYAAKLHDLRIRSSGGGFMVLMTNVKSFKIDKDHNLSVTTLKGQTFKSRLLLPKVAEK